ncbi:MAG: hypothetical protein Q4A06_04060 [Cardiobacteriaceae bacterium]|nr:hypothetical protein [Cardiobacteriaceae bacterium]
MNEMDVILIPTAGPGLLLPQAIVGKVFPYAPTLSFDEASEFVLGGLLIQNEKVPLLDFNFGHSAASEVDSAGFRLILVSTISEESRYSRYAILAHGEPELYLLREEDVDVVPSPRNHRYIAQSVTIRSRGGQETYIIPDLPLFETELHMR